MATTRLMISTGVQGNMIGAIFDDGLIIKHDTNVALTRIIVDHGLYINSLTMHYTGSHTPVTRGSTKNIRTEIILGPGELITTIDGNHRPHLFYQLRFKTNKGIVHPGDELDGMLIFLGVTFGPYGSGMEHEENVKPFVWNASDGAPKDWDQRMGLLYFSGSVDGYIRQLRATFALYPASEVAPEVAPEVAKPSSNVKFEQRVPTQKITAGGALSSFARPHQEIRSPVVVLVGPAAAAFYIPEATLSLVPFFRGTLQRGPQGAPDKEITLLGDRPEIFTALLEHLSTGSYTYVYDPTNTTVTDGAPAPDLTQGYFHVSVFQVARMYSWQPLVDAAVNNFRNVLAGLAGIDVIRLWKEAYTYGLTVLVCVRGGGLAHFKNSLPGLLKEVYKVNSEEMASTVMEFPALADDFMRLEHRG